MTADEMFKKLGYEIISTFKDTYIDYHKEDEGEHIVFYKLPKCIQCFIEEEINWYNISKFINMEEVKAINKKCEELGWE